MKLTNQTKINLKQKTKTTSKNPMNHKQQAAHT